MTLANHLLRTVGGGEEKLYAVDVFSTYLYTGNGATQTINNGIDLAGKGGLVWIKCRTTASFPHHTLWDSARVGTGEQRFGAYLASNLTYEEARYPSNFNHPIPGSTGFSFGAGGSFMNQNAVNYVSWTFRKAPKFFDVVTWTASGDRPRTVSHNLQVRPEFVIIKSRTGTSNANWYVSVNPGAGVNSYKGLMNSSYMLNLIPDYDTDRVFSDNTTDAPNTSIAYLFATLPGISKVGSYTGNGTTQTITCGFTTGARFILIKRTDATGNWYVWDTARGIVAGYDPHLSLDTSVTEVTYADSVGPHVSGFNVNQVAETNINVSGGQYIFLAIA